MSWIPEKDKKYFRDYKDIDLKSDTGKILYLNRKILFGDIEDELIPLIYTYFDKLTMEAYRRSYFTTYFRKYDFNGSTG